MAPRHEQIVSRILGSEYARLLTISIGIGEIFLAIWIVSRFKSRLCAIVQITAVAVMNIIEITTTPGLLLFGRWNALCAAAFIALVYWNEFLLRRGAGQQSYSWSHS